MALLLLACAPQTLPSHAQKVTRYSYSGVASVYLFTGGNKDATWEDVAPIMKAQLNKLPIEELVESGTTATFAVAHEAMAYFDGESGLATGRPA